jgi:O-antigen ligase
MSRSSVGDAAGRPVRATLGGAAALTHDSQRRVGGTWAAWRARTPPAWHLSVLACVLVFAGHLVYGANTDASALAFATAWLLFGGLALLLSGRHAPPAPSALMILAGVCFAGVVATVASQLLPSGVADPHPLWASVDGVSAFTIDRDATRRELLKLLAVGAAFSVGLVVGSSDRRTRLLVFLVVVASAAYAGWAFTQQFTAYGTIFGEPKGYHVERLTASFLSANSAATTLGMLAVFAVARVARAIKESSVPWNLGLGAVADQLARKAAVATIALVILVTCIVETLSRAGIAASAAALLALIAWEIRAASARGSHVRSATNAALAAAAAIAVLALMSAGGAVDRLEAAAGDADSRLTAFRAHWEAFLASPWRGYGLGSFPALNDTLQTPENFGALAELNALHNVYLQWLVETGVVGASLMFVCVALLLAHIWRGLRVRASMRTWLRAVLVASLLVLVHGLVDFALQVPSIAWQWALWLGVGCGIAAPRAQELQASAPDD